MNVIINLDSYWWTYSRLPYFRLIIFIHYSYMLLDTYTYLNNYTYNNPSTHQTRWFLSINNTITVWWDDLIGMLLGYIIIATVLSIYLLRGCQTERNFLLESFSNSIPISFQTISSLVLSRCYTDFAFPEKVPYKTVKGPIVPIN